MRGARLVAAAIAVAFIAILGPVTVPARSAAAGRERLLVDEGWRFKKDDPPSATLSREALLPWLLPTSNAFVKDPARRHAPAAGRLETTPYTQPGFDDSSWRLLDLPHDWGIEGPFTAEGSGGRGRLPFYGVGWYRKALDIP